MSHVAERIRNLASTPVEDAIGRFAHRAFAQGVAQVAFGRVPSPIGDLTALVTHKGLVALAFETDDLDGIMRSVARKVSPAIVRFPSAVGPVQSWIDAYFGARPVSELRLDRSLITPFQERVLTATSGIPLGEVRTYGQVASLAGNPKAARATGRALGANPIPIVLPCHRVVASDGSLHGYAGGLDRKRMLLDHEKAISV
ncbi:MAG: methylated-DNA--[protein]-cysteine S-methyltransferase [bacterium]|nr:methylated-DNA--[protein]-cysteine S-methyltransferase [bacterium]MDE0286975.1 methylated-DNA--[protein]-cysteine S-methyltransferase [bacterium]MDE0438874.1 methylated-DNA--[protein]-cysteine S-methyltransferase [bacterium]